MTGRYGVILCVAVIFFTVPLYADVNILTNPGFEIGDTTGWAARNCTIAASTAQKRSGSYSALASSRTATWQGIKQSILGLLNDGQSCTISGYVRLDNASSDNIKLTVEQADGNGTQYVPIQSKTGSNSAWTLLSGSFTLHVTGSLTKLDIYFEGPASGINFYVDDAAVMAAEPIGQIDPSVRYQNIEGFGAAGAWYENWLIAHPQRETLYDLFFDDLGLDIYRIRNSHDQGTDGADYMSRTGQIVAEAKQRNPNLKILICSWSPPEYLKSNGQISGGSNATLVGGPGSYNYAGFADWWADSIAGWSSYGVNADYISIQNEPDYDASWDSCRFNPTENSSVAGYDQAFEAVYSEMYSRFGSSMPRMLGPESTGFNGASGYNLSAYLSAIINHSHVYGYCHHLYNINAGDNPDAYLTAMQNFNTAWGSKPLFQTEYEKSTDAWPDALNIALLLHNALTVEEVSAYIYWDLFWGTSGGLITLPTYGSSAYTINSDYYGFKHYSAYIDAGWQRVEASSGNINLRISAYISPDDNSMTAVVVNPSTSAQAMTLTVGSFPFTSGQIYRSSSTENTVLIGSFTPGAAMTIPASSITTITMVGITDPTTCAQVQSMGYRLPEDLNGDCQIGLPDLIVLVNQWMSDNPESVAPNYSPDLVTDDNINLTDFKALADQWLICNDPEVAGCIETW